MLSEESRYELAAGIFAMRQVRRFDARWLYPWARRRWMHEMRNSVHFLDAYDACRAFRYLWEEALRTAARRATGDYLAPLPPSAGELIDVSGFGIQPNPLVVRHGWSDLDKRWRQGSGVPFAGYVRIRPK